MVTSFSGIGKDLDGFLNGKYKCLGSIGVSIKSGAVDGMKLNLYGKNKLGKDNVSGGVKWLQHFKKDDLDLECEALVREDGSIGENLELTGIAPGLTLGFNTSLTQKIESDKAPLADADAEAKKSRNQGEFLVNYVGNDGRCSANFSIFKKQLNDLDISLDVAGQVNDQIAFGVKVSGKPLKRVVEGEEDSCRRVMETDVSFGFKKDNLSCYTRVTDTGKKTALGFLSKTTSGVSFGAEWSRTNLYSFPWCYKGTQPKEKGPVEHTFTAGVSYDTESGTVNGKVDNAGKVSLSYDFDLRENLRASAAWETSVTKLGKDSKIGVQFTYSE